MAGKKMIGVDYSGNPVYAADPGGGISEEQFLRDLDRVVVMPDGKEYFELCGGEYYATDKNGNPDLSKVVTF